MKHVNLSDQLVSRSLNEVTSIEESYMAADGDHAVGTNLYTFTFNNPWRSKMVPLKIAIRKIHLNFSPRIFQVNGLSITDGDVIYNISPFVMITGSMTQANKAFQDDIKSHQDFYNAMPKNLYTIYYNPSSRKLVFEITTTDDWWFVIDDNATVSDDFKYITGKNTISDGTLTPVGQVTKIVFDNVWDRENVYVQASFVDLAYGNFLGVTNDSYHPPKTYPIVFGDQKFWIRLFDSLGNAIELPNDFKDNLIIESIMMI